MELKGSFTGSGTEYAAIWIVNVFLTIITLGLYYPWAKVRTQRYLHGNTFLLGNSFEYHATGKQIFKGFIIAWSLFVVYLLLEYFLPTLASAMIFVFGLVFLPWLIVQSIRFNMQVKSFKNIHFGFEGDVWQGYIVYGILPLVISIVVFGVAGFIASLWKGIGFNLVTLGVTLASFAIVLGLKSYLSSNYFVNSARYGQFNFSAQLDKNEFMKIYGIAITAFFVIFTLSSWLFTFNNIRIYSVSNIPDQLPKIIALVLTLLLAYFIYKAIVLSLTRNYLFSRINFVDNIQLNSELNFITLLWIYFSNYLMIVFTLGLATPWAKIRAVEYQVATFGLSVPEEIKQYMDKEKDQSNTLGDQVSEAFDVEIGGAIGF